MHEISAAGVIHSPAPVLLSDSLCPYVDCQVHHILGLSRSLLPTPLRLGRGLSHLQGFLLICGAKTGL